MFAREPISVDDIQVVADLFTSGDFPRPHMQNSAPLDCFDTPSPMKNLNLYRNHGSRSSPSTKAVNVIKTENSGRGRQTAGGRMQQSEREMHNLAECEPLLAFPEPGTEDNLDLYKLTREEEYKYSSEDSCRSSTSLKSSFSTLSHDTYAPFKPRFTPIQTPHSVEKFQDYNFADFHPKHGSQMSSMTHVPMTSSNQTQTHTPLAVPVNGCAFPPFNGGSTFPSGQCHTPVPLNYDAEFGFFADWNDWGMAGGNPNLVINKHEPRRLDENENERKEISKRFLQLVEYSHDTAQVPKKVARPSCRVTENPSKRKFATLNQTAESKVHECKFPGCKRQFAWLWALQEHEKRHSRGMKTRDFKCPTCDKAFYTKSCLKSHIKIHTRKPHSYKCKFQECEKTYSTSEGLRLHIRNHHQVDKRWACPVDDCEKKFVRQSDMRLHIMRIHAKTRPYPCRFESCKKSFACFSELRRHETSHVRRLQKKGAAEKAPSKKKVKLH